MTLDDVLTRLQIQEKNMVQLETEIEKAKRKTLESLSDDADEKLKALKKEYNYFQDRHHMLIALGITKFLLEILQNIPEHEAIEFLESAFNMCIQRYEPGAFQNMEELAAKALTKKEWRKAGIKFFTLKTTRNFIQIRTRESQSPVCSIQMPKISFENIPEMLRITKHYKNQMEQRSGTHLEYMECLRLNRKFDGPAQFYRTRTLKPYLESDVTNPHIFEYVVTVRDGYCRVMETESEQDIHLTVQASCRATADRMIKALLKDAPNVEEYMGFSVD